MSDLLLTEEPARRGFLRSLVMAPVAALATHRLIMPAQALVTPDDASLRLKQHMAGVEAAMRDLFPGAKVNVWGNCLDGHHIWYQRIILESREHGIYASVGCNAGNPMLYRNEEA
ncbi:MAG: hypothetical protein HYS63_09180, partial [Methylocystis sp.]|nr:hypothetical protein [Methylocystis sp.]